MSLGRHLSMKLNDGHFMPVLGFGTSAATKVITAALGTQETGGVPIGASHRADLKDPMGLPFLICKMCYDV